MATADTERTGLSRLDTAYLREFITQLEDNRSARVSDVVSTQDFRRLKRMVLRMRSTVRHQEEKNHE